MKKNILFIGAGRLGTTLALALSQSGLSIPIFFSKEFPENKTDNLSDTRFVKELTEENIENSDVLIITVPDAQIEVVKNQLEFFDINWHNKLVLHTSGCLSSIELNSLNIKGAQVGSIHPMQSFDKVFLPKEIFKGVVFAVEGDEKIIIFAQSIAELLNANLIKLNPEDKILYHIAAVASSNFIVALLDYINQMYRKLGFGEEKIRELILPIINQTLKNFQRSESKDILTGPLKRNDFITIEKHVKYLKENQNTLFPVYKEISKYISQFLLNQNESEKDKLSRILYD